jgi:hypothetical protein
VTPLKIKILLHYYAIASDYQQDVKEDHARSRAVGEALEFFVEQGILKPRFTDVSWCCWRANWHEDVERPLFLITSKGEAMVEALMAVQIPVCKWVQPESTK